MKCIEILIQEITLDTTSAIENSTRWLSMQLRDIDRDPHPHDLAAVALSLQVENLW